MTSVRQQHHGVFDEAGEPIVEVRLPGWQLDTRPMVEV